MCRYGSSPVNLDPTILHSCSKRWGSTSACIIYYNLSMYTVYIFYTYKCHHRSVCVCEIEQHRCIITCMHVSIPHVCLFLLHLCPSIVRDTLITNIETQLSSTFNLHSGDSFLSICLSKNCECKNSNQGLEDNRITNISEAEG